MFIGRVSIPLAPFLLFTRRLPLNLQILHLQILRNPLILELMECFFPSLPANVLVILASSEGVVHSPLLDLTLQRSLRNLRNFLHPTPKHQVLFLFWSSVLIFTTPLSLHSLDFLHCFTSPLFLIFLSSLQVYLAPSHSSLPLTSFKKRIL